MKIANPSIKSIVHPGRIWRDPIIFVAFLLLLGLSAWFLVTWLGKPKRLSILATNTIRSKVSPDRAGEFRMGGVLLLETALKTLERKAGHDFVLLDAGNSLFGHEGTSGFANEMFDFFRDNGYHGITIGHRDFELSALIEKGKVKRNEVPILACNLKAPAWEKALDVRPGITVIVAGRRVAIVGLVDPDLPLVQSPDDVRRVQVDSAEQSARKVQEAFNQLAREGNVDLRILLSSALKRETNLRIWRLVSEIDVVVGIGAEWRTVIQRHDQVQRPVLAGASDGKGIAVLTYQWEAGIRTALGIDQVPVTSNSYDPSITRLSSVRDFWIRKVLETTDATIIGAADSEIPYEIDHDIDLEYFA